MDVYFKHVDYGYREVVVPLKQYKVIANKNAHVFIQSSKEKSFNYLN